MLIRHFTHGSVQLSKVLVSSSRNGLCNFNHMSTSPRLCGILNVTVAKSISCPGFSVMAGDVTSHSNGEANSHPAPQRTYEVVAAATRDMGIGKNGKLPWRLPSDLKFFKEITTTTKDPERKNAMIMGRKTWESIPIEYRPLPARLNVVLTRSWANEMASEQNVIKCGSVASALEVLAGPPYCLSIAKVFVIGGGQIFRETLNAPGCEAIHITEIETSFDCDTFIPDIDPSLFRLSYRSVPVVENNIRYSFVTYVRVRNFANGTPGVI